MCYISIWHNTVDANNANIDRGWKIGRIENILVLLVYVWLGDGKCSCYKFTHMQLDKENYLFIKNLCMDRHLINIYVCMYVCTYIHTYV